MSDALMSSPRRRRLRQSLVAAAGLLGAALLAGASGAGAHDAWIEVEPEGPAVRFGHVGEPEAVDATRIRKLGAVDVGGHSLAVSLEPAERAVRLKVDGKPALLALDYDNGYWSRPPGASTSVNQPRNEVPGAESGARVLKFGKTIVQWSAVVTRALGQALEIVPVADRAPAAGEHVAVRVLWQGQPLSGARVLYGSAEGRPPVVQADEAGRADVPISGGPQFLSVSHRAPLANDPGADSQSVSANLVFEAR